MLDLLIPIMLLCLHRLLFRTMIPRNAIHVLGKDDGSLIVATDRGGLLEVDCLTVVCHWCVFFVVFLVPIEGLSFASTFAFTFALFASVFSFTLSLASSFAFALCGVLCESSPVVFGWLSPVLLILRSSFPFSLIVFAVVASCVSVVRLVLTSFVLSVEPC